MKDCTRVRRLTKLWVAWNDRTITTEVAVVKICKLLRFPQLKLEALLKLLNWDGETFIVRLHDANKAEFLAGWNAYMKMTDLGRKRFLKEIMP